MELRSDQIKRGVARAPHRSLLKADGITDEEMDRPFIAVLSSRNDVIPGHTHLDKIAEAAKGLNIRSSLNCLKVLAWIIYRDIILESLYQPIFLKRKT